MASRSNPPVPEFGEVIDKARRQARIKAVQSQITIVRESGERNFAVRVTREKDDKADFGVVLTFDDITDLVARAAHRGLGRCGAAHRA